MIAGNGMKQLVLCSIVPDEKVSDGYYYLLLNTPNVFWAYPNTDAPGLDEYRNWYEDMGMTPILGVWSGPLSYIWWRNYILVGS